MNNTKKKSVYVSHPLNNDNTLDTLAILEAKVINKSHNLNTITSLMEIYTVK